jgi:hypothetical protein
MKTTSGIWLLKSLFLLSCISAAYAEGGCPPGQYPQQGQGWQTCVPIPGGATGQSNAPAPERWIDNWQAIATDANKGALGTSVGEPTAAKAESLALGDCRAKGGIACDIQVSYRNGCVAMVVGDKRMATRGAPTKDSAERQALTKCSEEDTNCHVFYSACSLPERVQ